MLHFDASTGRSKGVIDWVLPERELYFLEDGILLVNRSRTSIFCLPKCTLWVNVIFKSALTKIFVIL